MRPSLLVVDSIQAVTVEGVEARAGGPAHLAEAGALLASWARETGTAVVVTGHVTKSGDIAGPRLLEHLVDAVLYFEGESRGLFRVLRAEKNRFGATDEVGVFEMTGAGLASVSVASSMSAAHRLDDLPTPFNSRALLGSLLTTGVGLGFWIYGGRDAPRSSAASLRVGPTSADFTVRF